MIVIMNQGAQTEAEEKEDRAEDQGCQESIRGHA